MPSSLVMKMVYLKKTSKTSSSFFMAGFKAHLKRFLQVYGRSIQEKGCGQISRHCSCPIMNVSSASESKDLISSGYSTMSVEESAFSTQNHGFGGVQRSHSKTYHQVYDCQTNTHSSVKLCIFVVVVVVVVVVGTFKWLSKLQPLLGFMFRYTSRH